MKKIVTLFSLLALTAGEIYAGSYNSLWQPVDAAAVPSKGAHVIRPDHFLAYYSAPQVLEAEMAGLSENPANAQIFSLPMPDGTFRSFRVWQTPVMEKGLSDRYSGMYTFTAEATDNHAVTAKMDITPYGFHAMIFDGSNTVFIDPYSNINDGYYQSYYRHDYSRPGQPMTCDVADDDDNPAGTPMALGRKTLPLLNFARTNGTQLKKYRLALACTGEYAVAVAGANPTKANVLSKMVTSLNRVNGVYERELAVTMLLISNTDTLIALDTADGYTNNSGSTMLGQNQTIVTARIGSANYDIGHVFSTGGGGIASLGCVCSNSFKAQGVTGLANPIGDAFDIDYVAHEMGHQYGANHTFNANTGSCASNGVAKDAYEPGSGSTIMAYAGICGSGDNLQQHSDAYFHATSLTEITTYITNSTGANCPTITTSTNTPNTVASFTTSYNIPILTPFELTAPAATDATADTLNYCWEEWDLGDFKNSWTAIRLAGPIFRSFLPDTSRTRIFPTLTKLLAGTISYIGEKLPDTARTLKFKLTTRDIYQGNGCFNFGSDSITLNVIYTGTAFSVVSAATASTNWMGGSTQTITWNTSSTDVAPISCAYVSIYLSTDGGYTYPYTLASHVANNGTATVTVPNTATTTKARIKVKGDGNVFFNINKVNFTLTHDNTLPWPAGVSNISLADHVKVYPVPATDVLHLTSGIGGKLQVMIVNAAGQSVWKGDMNQSLDIPVGSWAKGVYFVGVADASTGQHTVYPVSVQ